MKSSLTLFVLITISWYTSEISTYKAPYRLEDAIRDFVDDWDRDHHYNRTELSVEDQDPVNGTSTSDEDTLSIGLPFSRNCSQCGSHEETRVKRIDAIKALILSKMGLSQAPNITNKNLPRIPPLKDYWPSDMLSDSPGTESGYFVPGPVFGEDDDSYHVETEKVITFAEDPLPSWNLPKEFKCKYFNFSSSLYNSHVAKAHLGIFLRPNSDKRNSPARVVIYQVAKDQSTRGHTLLQVRTKKVEFKSMHGDWVTIDVRKLVAQWFRHPNENLGLVVHSYDNDGQELTLVESQDTDSMVPFIEIKVENLHHRRTKRMVGLNCEENSSEVRCCRYPLTVDFEEFGWDWIIAPKRYEANYCSGECPYVFLQKYAHTHLVQQANPQGSAGPCCAPRKMSSISMLYFNDKHTIIYGMLPGMVVERCGCS